MMDHQISTEVRASWFAATKNIFNKGDRNSTGYSGFGGVVTIMNVSDFVDEINGAFERIFATETIGLMRLKIAHHRTYRCYEAT
jgi:hypothetical protein